MVLLTIGFFNVWNQLNTITGPNNPLSNVCGNNIGIQVQSQNNFITPYEMKIIIHDIFIGIIELIVLILMIWDASKDAKTIVDQWRKKQ